MTGEDFLLAKTSDRELVARDCWLLAPPSDSHGEGSLDVIYYNFGC